MEKLISFITGNFYIVFVIVGIIYSLFFRKSPLEQRPNRTPDFGGGNQQRSRPSAEVEPLSTPVSRSEPLELNEDPYAAHQHDELPVVKQRPARLVESLQQESKPEEHSSPVFTKNDLTRAVVWAEILGPPRARRPYRR
ncbi:hypothetical protein [Cohnella sp. WQ 127256]|uniref:hypothetical protein n=1 Tax=Cohnella sp. WQ 127256 TaxID=2938790 RepID=UPI002118BC81|nr:hypothetical protein [Cohnella sp. WQ 127256]